MSDKSSDMDITLLWGGDCVEIDGFHYQVSGPKNYGVYIWPISKGFSIAYSAVDFTPSRWSVNVIDEDVPTFCVWYKEFNSYRKAQKAGKRVKTAIWKRQYREDEQGFVVFPWYKFLRSDD